MPPLNDRHFDAPPAGIPWNSRATLLAAFVLLTVIASLAYSGPSVGMMSLRLLLDGGVLLLWIAAAAGLGSTLLPKLSQTDAPAPGTLIAVTSIALGLGVFSLLALGLGLLGWLNGITAWALLALGVACGIVRIIRRDTPETRATLQTWLSAPAGAGWLALLASPFIALAIVGAMAPPGFLWSPDEPHGYDVIEYHLQLPREWYELGRIVPLHHNVFSYFPFNVEMHYLLAMHLRGGPWAGMFLAQLMHVAFCFLSVGAVYAAVRTLGDPWRATLAAVAVAAVPWTAMLGAVAYNEGGVLLWGTLAVGLVVLRKSWVLAGVMAGFACGAKLTAVPMLVIGIPV